MAIDQAPAEISIACGHPIDYFFYLQRLACA